MENSLDDMKRTLQALRNETFKFEKRLVDANIEPEHAKYCAFHLREIFDDWNINFERIVEAFHEQDAHKALDILHSFVVIYIEVHDAHVKKHMKDLEQLLNTLLPEDEEDDSG